jgi:hypothetical protein
MTQAIQEVFGQALKVRRKKAAMNTDYLKALLFRTQQ